MTARCEPCDCTGIPHRRLIVEKRGCTLFNVCEWAYWLMRNTMAPGREPWPDACYDALIASGLEPTEPVPEWRAILAAMGG